MTTKVYAPEMALMAGQPVVGYSTMFRVYKNALKEKGFDVVTEQGDIQLNFMPPLWWEGMIKRYPAKKRVVCSMWEADGVEKKWVETANKHFDALVVPNGFNKKLFESHGLTIPCYAVGLGIQKEYMNYIKRDYKKGDDFYFLHYNAGETRKGWYALIDAFDQEFKDEPNVKLIVKNSGVRENTMNKTLSYYDDVKKKTEVHRGKYSLDQMMDLAEKAHAFVFPAIGEGYSLTPREMMATGMPVIIGSGHSFDEMADYYIKTPAELKKTGQAYKPRIADSISGLSYIHDPYRNYNMWYVDVDALKANMRDVYENYDQHLTQSKKGSQDVKKSEDIDVLIKPLAELLTTLV
jgi:glycosyltransferase involved in cell wall biosynthesis